MAEQTNREKTTLEENQNGGFSLTDIWNIVVLHWPWIILSVVICLAGAFAYLRYATPVYSAQAKILIKEDNGSHKKGAGGLMGLTEMGVISNTDGFDNELEIIKSTTINNAVVKALDLNIKYFTHGQFRDIELYKCSPINVSMSESDMSALNKSVKMDLTPNGMGFHARIEIPGSDPKNPYVKEENVRNVPASISTPVGTFKFERNNAVSKFEIPIKVQIIPRKVAGSSYAARLSAQASSKTTTVAVLGLVDSQPQRALDYLKQLMISYNEDANQDKNEVATKTKEFVNERIEDIGSELNITEAKLEEYKKDNDLINLTNDATNALANTTDYQREQVEIQTQITLAKSLNDYVNNPANEYQVIPANLGISDPLVNAQISKYNEALQQYNRLAKSGAENNPVITKLTDEMQQMHSAITQSLRKINSDLMVQKRSIDGQLAMFSGRISRTPTQERVLNEIGRKQEIQIGLYLTLLQKREENLISLASTATKAKWIDEPQMGGQVAPRNNMIWLIALLIGICLPIGIFYLRQLLRYKIEGRNDIEKLTPLSILADIPLAHDMKTGERAIVVEENSNNSMEESFRGLRTNMRFVMKDADKVILCTSTIPGEGKTFVCTNLAMSYALLGKRVLVVGLDIRKPQLVRLFKLPSNKSGITSFLANDACGFDVLEEQIFHGVINSNLDVMPAGIIPPNPSELISRQRLDDAINYLRDKYDVILLDTPPVGLVSDTLELGRLADVTLFVCRADYTPKSNFGLINTLKDEEKLPKMSIVLNGVDLRKKKYGYYYGYGKYGKYGKYGYGRYGHYGHYGHYGVYGSYGHNDNDKKGKNHTEK